MSEKTKKEGSINIELDPETAQGIYSNLAIINHSGSEFVVDFVTIMPGAPKAKVRSRIVLTPQHAKRFLKAYFEHRKAPYYAVFFNSFYAPNRRKRGSGRSVKKSFLHTQDQILAQYVF